MSGRDSEEYGTREAIACAAFGYHVAAVHPESATILIDDTAGALGAALDKAMQVKITDKIISAGRDAIEKQLIAIRPIIEAAFRAAGFEVVE